MAPPSVPSTTTFSFSNRLNLGPRAVTWAPFVPDRRQRRLTPGGRLAPVWSGQPPDPRLSGPVFRPLVRVSADWAAASAGHCMYLYVCGSVVAGLKGKGLSERSTCTCRAVLYIFSGLLLGWGWGGGEGGLRLFSLSLFSFFPFYKDLGSVPFRAQELCEIRGRRLAPNSPYGLCGREITLKMKKFDSTPALPSLPKLRFVGTVL